MPKESGGLSRAHTSQNKTDEVGSDLENDNPPGIGNRDFAFGVGSELSDLLFG